MPAVADMQNTIIKEFKYHPDVEVFIYNQGGRFDETEEWLKTAWDNYYLNGTIIYDETGVNATEVYGQPMSGLPFGRGYIIKKDGVLDTPFFCHQPEFVINRIYELLGEPDSTYEMVIPHITGGENNWKDVLQVDNHGTFSTSFTVLLYDESGQALSQTAFSINSLSTKQVILKDLADGAKSGKVFYDNASLSFRMSHESLGSGGVAEFQLSDSTSDTLTFNFSNAFPETVGWKGIAIHNPELNNQNITLYAIGNGTILGTATDVIPARTKISNIHTHWFSNINVSDIERILVVSDNGSLTGITISGSSDLSKLLFTSALIMN